MSISNEEKSELCQNVIKHAVVYALSWQRWRRCQAIRSSRLTVFDSYCSWLLLLAGDIETNPGPVRYPCTMCAKPVRVNQRGVMCDTCNLWTHASCYGISRDEYDIMSLQGDSCAWMCPKCALSTLPFANTSTLSVYDDEEALIGDNSQAGGDRDLYMDHMGECDRLAKQNPRDIRFIHYNIQSLLSVLDSFRITHERKPFSLVCLTETWLTEDVADHEVNLSGYSIIRRDRSYAGKVRGGGVAIYVDDELSTVRRIDLEHETLEHIVLEVRVEKRKHLSLVICVYIPPKDAVHVLGTLSTVLEKCIDCGLDVILMGDLNHDQLKNPNALSAICHTYHMDHLIQEPTRSTPHSQSLLDVVLTINKERICDSGVLCHSMSDHSAIYCIYQSALRTQSGFVTYRDMKHFCDNSFRCDILKVPWLVCEVFDDVDDQYYAWHTLFMEVVNLHAPLKTKKCRKRLVPWMTPDIRELMRQRDKTHRIAIKERSEHHFCLP